MIGKILTISTVGLGGFFAWQNRYKITGLVQNKPLSSKKEVLNNSLFNSSDFSDLLKINDKELTAYYKCVKNQVIAIHKRENSISLQDKHKIESFCKHMYKT